MNSVPTNSNYSRMITIALFLGFAVLSTSSKMLEFDADLVMKKTNNIKARKMFNQRMSLRIQQNGGKPCIFHLVNRKYHRRR